MIGWVVDIAGISYILPSLLLFLSKASQPIAKQERVNKSSEVLKSHLQVESILPTLYHHLKLGQLIFQRSQLLTLISRSLIGKMRFHSSGIQMFLLTVVVLWW